MGQVRAHCSEGLLTGYEFAVSDVTEHKIAEQSIALREAMLDQVLSAVIATDLEGLIIYWNKQAEVLYGYPAEEVIGKSIGDVTVPFEGQQIAKSVGAALLRDGQWPANSQFAPRWIDLPGGSGRQRRPQCRR